MTSLTGFRRSVSWAERAISRLVEDQVPPRPNHFEVWYTYYEQSNPRLSAAIDRALLKGDRLDEAALEQIHAAHILGKSTSVRVEEISGKVAQEIAVLADSVTASAGAAAEYSSVLTEASVSLANSAKTDQIVGMVKGLVDATLQTSAVNRLLETQLARSKKELKGLRSDLAAISLEALTDPLTGLSNRRYFDQSLQNAIVEAGERQTPFALLIADIDRFKSFNDTFGHVAGDQVLKLVAAAIRGGVRDGDLTCRYGGEEFAIILPDTSLAEACTVGERVRRAVMGREMVKRPTGEKLGRLTVSIGAAVFSSGDEAQAILERADACLYVAKLSGRNRLIDESQARSMATSMHLLPSEDKIAEEAPAA